MTWYARVHRLPQKDVEYFCEECGMSSKEQILNVVGNTKDNKRTMLCGKCYNGIIKINGVK